MATLYYSKIKGNSHRASMYFRDKARAERKIVFQTRLMEDASIKTEYELAECDDEGILPAQIV